MKTPPGGLLNYSPEDCIAFVSKSFDGSPTADIRQRRFFDAERPKQNSKVTETERRNELS
jgi:hypothetical protein